MLPHTPYQSPRHFVWRGITIEVRYTPVWFDMPGYQVVHLEVRSMLPERHPLPFTDTGYRSMFLTTGHTKARTEAKASGLPVVVGWSIGMAELVRHGENGLLVR